MCKANTPTYTPPPKYARPQEPDNAALYDEAVNRAAMRGGGKRRSTILSGLSGATTPPVLGRAGQQQQPATVLG